MHLDAKLFLQFADAGIVGSLSALDLTAGKLPKTLHVSVTALNGKHRVVLGIADDAGGYMHGLHR